MILKKVKPTLKQSLVLLVAIPFIGYISTLLIHIDSSNKNLKIIAIQVHNSEYIYSSSKLISSLQKERGLSATLINGGDVRSKVEDARKSVDTMFIEALDSFKSVSIYTPEIDSYNVIQTLVTQKRKTVDNKSISFVNIMGNYSAQF